MKELENRTILEKYGIEEITIFLNQNDLFKDIDYLAKLNELNKLRIL